MRNAILLSITAILIALIVPCVFGESLELLNQEIAAVDTKAAELKKQYDSHKKANEDRLKKADPESLRDAYQAAEQLNRINADLNQIHQQRATLCNRWREEYKRTIDGLLLQANQENDRRKKGEIGKKLQTYQSRNAQLCASLLRLPSSNEWKSIQIESYDGPEEMRQKTMLLNDIARELSIDLAKLEQQFQDYQRDQQTRERAQEFIQESTLFTDTLTVRPATRSDGMTTHEGGPVNQANETTTPAQILGAGDWPSQMTNEEFEMHYQKMRNEFIAQQKQLKLKIQQFEKHGKTLMNQ